MADGSINDNKHHRVTIRVGDPTQKAAVAKLAHEVMTELEVLPEQNTIREEGTGEPTMAPWSDLKDTPPWITDAYREAMGLPN